MNLTCNKTLNIKVHFSKHTSCMGPTNHTHTQDTQHTELSCAL